VLQPQRALPPNRIDFQSATYLGKSAKKYCPLLLKLGGADVAFVAKFYELSATTILGDADFPHEAVRST
jgi:hypothetical protein